MITPPQPMTAAELDAAVASLRAVGGLYELLALIVERDNRPHIIEVKP